MKSPASYMSAISPMRLAGLFMIVLFLALAIFAPLVAPHDPWKTEKPYLPPGGEHPLGTNDIGQDILSELIYATRVSLSIGFLAGFLSVFVGASLGMLAGYYRGAVEEVVMAVSDMVLLIPGLPFMIILAAYLSPSMYNIVLVVSLLWWCPTARVVHSRVLQLREMPFVEAAISLGGRDSYIIIHHILINSKEIIYAKLALSVASAMATEASLSFLGLGDPLSISWGEMIHFSFSRGGFANDMWWWYLPPGIMICASVLSFVMIGMESERTKRMVEL